MYLSFNKQRNWSTGWWNGLPRWADRLMPAMFLEVRPPGYCSSGMCTQSCLWPEDKGVQQLVLLKVKFQACARKQTFVKKYLLHCTSVTIELQRNGYNHQTRKVKIKFLEIVSWPVKKVFWKSLFCKVSQQLLGSYIQVTMLVHVLCHLGKICGKHSESDWDFSFARRNIRIRIYVQHILLFLNSSINMHLFKTIGRKPSPDQLQIRFSCHVLSILGWKHFCRRSCSTSAIRLLATKYFLFSSWEGARERGVPFLPFPYSNCLAADKFTKKPKQIWTGVNATPLTHCVATDHSRITVWPNVTLQSLNSKQM